jgi:DNA-binding NtrC family response regulator
MGSFSAPAPDVSRALIGSAPAMQAIVEKIDRIGPNPFAVLILGETGTGKEVIARRIHSRGTGPFVVVDCSSLVGPLMESELFGHVKGAFTGATGNKLGLIEMANGGTAFFDEIGELPLDLQAKLLRVIQEKEFRPVGAVRSRTSDFRLIAATHRDLSADVKAGKFREDLLYRLKVITLRVPPVRDRSEDIPELISHFLRRHKSSHTFERHVLDAMLSYYWPGNVRELDNCVQHAVAHARSHVIGLQDLPTTIANHVIATRSDVLTMARAIGHPAPESSTPESFDDPLPRDIVTLAEMERRHILRVLDYTHGDRASAALHLGIGRTTLYRKLKEYGIPGSPASLHAGSESSGKM